MELLECMKNRRSVRQYREEHISEKQIRCVLEAGLLAPSSRNLKPCTFYVIRDKKHLEELASAKAAGGAFLGRADAAIVVCGDAERADTWIEDCAIAMTYMNLMAADQGIGCCWCQIHLRETKDGKSAEDAVRAVLCLENRFRIVGILALGWPEKEPTPHGTDNLAWDCVHEIPDAMGKMEEKRKDSDT